MDYNDMKVQKSGDALIQYYEKKMGTNIAHIFSRKYIYHLIIRPFRCIFDC